MNEREKGHTSSSVPIYTWLLSRRPNFMASFTHPLRLEAVRHLQLEPGERVLDVGCGSGTSFSYLVQAVGSLGEVVGVEISSEMAAQARKRIEREKWSNVSVLEGSAQTIPLTGSFDGLLLFAAHEVLTSNVALDHLLLQVKEHGYVVAFGAKLLPGLKGKLLNPLIQLFTRMLLPALSAPINEHPWQLLEERTEMLYKEDRVQGFMYLVWGPVRHAQN